MSTASLEVELQDVFGWEVLQVAELALAVVLAAGPPAVRAAAAARRAEAATLKAALERADQIWPSTFFLSHLCSLYSTPDPATSRWQLRCLPRAPFIDCGAAWMGGRLWTVGGHDYAGGSEDSLLRFDHKTSSVASMRPSPMPRSGCAVVALAGRLYVIGGYRREECGDNSEELDAVTCFDPDSNSWSAVPAMPVPLSLCAAVATAGSLVVIGTSVRDVSARVFQFNVLQSSWVVLPPLLSPRVRCAAAAFAGRVYACGGLTPPDIPVAEIESLSLADGVWESLPPMPTARNSAAAMVAKGHLYIFAGAGECGPTPSVERMDLETLQWEELLPLPEPFSAGCYCAASVVRGG